MKGQMLNPQEFNQNLNNNVNRRLAEKEVDFKLSEAWWQAALLALKYESPFSISLPGKAFAEFKQKLQKREQLNYLEFAILNNAIESKTEHQLEGSLFVKSYEDLMIEVEEHTVIWNKFLHSIEEEAKQETIAQMSQNSEEGDIPLGKIMPMGQA